jgi:hypothetical protein
MNVFVAGASGDELLRVPPEVWLGRKTWVASRANTLGHARNYDVAWAFLNDTDWPL